MRMCKKCGRASWDFRMTEKHAVLCYSKSRLAISNKWHDHVEYFPIDSAGGAVHSEKKRLKLPLDGKPIPGWRDEKI